MACDIVTMTKCNSAENVLGKYDSTLFHVEGNMLCVEINIKRGKGKATCYV